MAVATDERGHASWSGQEISASCFIDGRWLEAESDAATHVVNPATEELLARVSFASATRVQEAIGAARRAFDGGPWPETSPHDRARLLERLAELFEERLDEFVEHITDETGSPTYLARAAQVETTLDVFRWFADAARRGPVGGGYEHGLPILDDPVMAASLVRQEPVGVVSAITAFNYPLFLLARKLGGVLASGCTAVVMPSERAPLSTLRFFELIEEAGYPDGVANLVIGSKDVGVELSSNPSVDMISFTGSVAVGSAVMAQAAKTTKKVVLELGGKSPTIVLPGANLEAAVPSSVTRFTWTTGQACGCTTRTFVSEADFEPYVEAAEEFMSELKVGDPRAEGTKLGPLIREEQRASVEGYVERALDGGGEVVAGGGQPDEPSGYYMNPALIAGVDNDSEIARNELFGPVGVVMRYESIEEVVSLANDSPYGLNAVVWGPTDAAMKVARRLRSGTVGINGGGGNRPDAPWGGPKQSGVGREGGEDGFRDFFEAKHVQWPIAAP